MPDPPCSLQSMLKLSNLRQSTKPTKIGQRIAYNLEPEGKDIDGVETWLVTNAHLPQSVPARDPFLACATPRPITGSVEGESETEKEAGLLFYTPPTLR